jgi:uncharacterized SAM-dependent methyltransferase
MFTKLQLNKIVHQLEKWNIPIKYSYISEEWAKAWENLENNDETCNWGFNYDSNLLQNTIDLYISELEIDKEINLFDFGSWIWKTIVPTIKYLEEKWYKINYHAFDISENIIELLKQNFIKNNVNIKVNYTIIDFEDKDLSECIFEARWNYNNWPILGLFLWNTIWNLNSIEKVLSNIMDSLELRDKLLIWIERVDLENDRWMNNMLEWYKTDNSQKHDFATLKYLWFEKEYWDFKIVFNKTKLSIEDYFIFKKDYKIEINWEIFNFKKWEKIKIFSSKKINEEEFSKILN